MGEAEGAALDAVLKSGSGHGGTCKGSRSAERGLVPHTDYIYRVTLVYKIFVRSAERKLDCARPVDFCRVFIIELWPITEHSQRRACSLREGAVSGDSISSLTHKVASSENDAHGRKPATIRCRSSSRAQASFQSPFDKGHISYCEVTAQGKVRQRQEHVLLASMDLILFLSCR